MHSLKSFLLVVAVFLYSSNLLYGQACGGAISAVTNPLCYGDLLKASPTGTGFRYQWLQDGVPVLGATQPNFAVQTTGKYAVIVSGLTCLTDTSDVVDVTVTEQEAKFNADDKKRFQPQSPAPLCGVPVVYTLENESTGDNLTYEWEVTTANGDPAPAAEVEFVAPSTNTSENPVLKFFKEGQYTIKLKIKGACNPNGEDGPLDQIDPDNPDDEPDGRYVHEESVVIVYPQVTPQNTQFCVNPADTNPYPLTGKDLIGDPDANLGTIVPNSFIWTVPAGVTISGDITGSNPDFLFSKPNGTYNLTVSFRNECFSSADLNGPTQIEVTFTPTPPKPTLTTSQVFVCEGSTYEIAPTPNNRSRLYNFYAAPAGGKPLNFAGPQPSFSAGPLNGRTVVYISAVENTCESVERAEFTINIISQDLTNTIGVPETICSDTRPKPLIGNNVQIGAGTPRYFWKSKEEGASDFTAAIGNNTQVGYSPPALAVTTTYIREVTFAGCDIPNVSDEVTITVLPVIEPTNNTINANKVLVCRGTKPTFTGSQINGDVEYQWQSSTTSATAGFVPASGTDITNGAAFTPTFVAQPTWFRRVARYKISNCTFVPSEAILINIEELPQPPIVKNSTVSTCEGSSANLEVITDGMANITYAWYTELTGGSAIGSGSLFVTPELEENTTFYVESVSANECVSSRRTPVRVTVAPISASAGRDTTIIQGQSIQLNATGGSIYKWTPATGLSNPDIANPLATPPVGVNTYTVTVSNGSNCEATAEVTITVIPRLGIVNTFSPNRDGTNELWDILNIENYPTATVEIFNRYGAQVFKSTGYRTPWDGTHNGSPLPMGTYYYIIRLNKDEKPLTGSVTIIK